MTIIVFNRLYKQIKQIWLILTLLNLSELKNNVAGKGLLLKIKNMFFLWYIIYAGLIYSQRTKVQVIPY